MKYKAYQGQDAYGKSLFEELYAPDGCDWWPLKARFILHLNRTLPAIYLDKFKQDIIDCPDDKNSLLVLNQRIKTYIQCVETEYRRVISD